MYSVGPSCGSASSFDVPALAASSAWGILMPAKRGRPFSGSILADFLNGVGQGEDTLRGSDSKVNMEAMLSTLLFGDSTAMDLVWVLSVFF